MLRAWVAAARLAVLVTSSVPLQQEPVRAAQLEAQRATQPETPRAAEPETQRAAQVETHRAHLVLGYYVPYDVTSWASLRAHVDQLDYVGAQWVTLDVCGNL